MKKLFVVLFLITAIVAPSFTQNRYALVIGNANYQRIEKLNNTVHDAQDIGAALRRLGYQVVVKTDLRHLDMIDEVEAFTVRLRSNRNSEGFFWYAGHAVQIRDENYLLPIDVTVDNESRVRAQSYSLNNLLESLEGAHNKVNIIVLDSCRDNPLPTGSRGTGARGLSVIRDVPSDLFIMFSTAPGDKAEDGVGNRNSPFALAFLKHIESSEPLVIMAAHVTNETLSLTGQRQRPFHRGSIISDAYYSLNPARPVANVPVQPTPVPTPTPAPAAQPAAPPVRPASNPKYALVIGNSDYTGISKLFNPVNDANDVAAALQGLGFTVDKVLNGSLDQMENAITRFKNRLSASRNSYGFLFYAGHGVQSNGQNYLIPVNAANIQSESSLRNRATSVQAMLSELNDAGNELNVVVLDACRDNPFGWARSGSRGLAVPASQPADSIIVYAASAGSAAADGTGRNGLFTGNLLNNLRTPGLEVNEVFRLTISDVSRATNNHLRPAVYNQFFGSAYLGSRP